MRALSILLAILLIFSWTSAAAESDHFGDVTNMITVNWTTEDVDMLARLIFTEARGVPSKMEQAAVAWCVLNRVDSDRWPDSIAEVVTQKSQFAWEPSAPLIAEFQILAENVLWRWSHEQNGIDSGRVLPREYMNFSGDGTRNHFRKVVDGKKVYYNWSLENPYED